MSDVTLLAAVRHNVWANLELLAFCQRLAPDQLERTVPGTYGTIHATLQHIVGAEHGYLFALTGGDLPPGGRLTPDRIAPLDELVERERWNSDRVERLLAEDLDGERVITRPRGDTATARVILSQFIHHGSDHRAHVGTILGASGVEPPELDVWAYGTSISEVTEP